MKTEIRIIVIRKRGRLFLYVLNGKRTVERVTAQNSTLLWDYIRTTWPVGTRTQWAVMREQPPCKEVVSGFWKGGVYALD